MAARQCAAVCASVASHGARGGAAVPGWATVRRAGARATVAGSRAACSCIAAGWRVCATTVGLAAGQRAGGLPSCASHCSGGCAAVPGGA